MSRRSARPRVALVLKRTGWRTFVEERRDPHVRRLLREKCPTVTRLRGSHEEHEATVREVCAALDALDVVVTRFDRPYRRLEIQNHDLVVTVGGDGTLLAASHGVRGIPILGVNSAPSHSVGFFCGARRGGAARAIEQALRGELRKVELTRMAVRHNGGDIAVRVLNDALFCHVSPAATSRYLITVGRVSEEHKSSGFWIGPAAGSTAAQRSAGGRVLPLTSRKLQLVVREPYMPAGERYALQRRLVEDHEAVLVRSKIREARIFLDGPDTVVEVRLGDTLEFRVSDEPLTLLGIPSRRRGWGRPAA